MSNIIFYSTDDNTVGGTVKVDGVAYPITSGSTVLAFIQTMNSATKILDDITILETDDGNDWPNGVIEGVFTDAESIKLANYNEQRVRVVVRITTGAITQSWTETVTAGKLL